MNDATKEAAYIMRHHKPKLIGDLFDIARTRARDEDGKGAFLSPEGDDHSHAWGVVDAHTMNLRNTAYRIAAGLEEMATC